GQPLAPDDRRSAAAVARIAACAADPGGTAYINVTQTAALIERLLGRGIYVLFLSTNQVFDGNLPQMPTDAPYSPISEYGRQKMRAEMMLREHMARGAPAGILRLAKVVSPKMPLVEAWAANLAAGKTINAFSDMTLAPTPIDRVCKAITALLHERPSGIFQLTGPRDITYTQVGRLLATRLNADLSLVRPTRARDAGLPEGSTPHHTTLESRDLQNRYGIEVPDVGVVIENLAAAARDSLESTASNLTSLAARD
ncbi:MAG TPA: sugar nucleotide-binding protein, partial [Xanthobacteraceae bacterium]|nr:sugar nucleotide-binding protein [Xanthobacteraceae bacterium]